MNNPKSKRPPGGTGMSSREIEASIRRIEDDLYFGSDNIKIRLTRIEEKLEHVVTRDDLKAFATRDDLKAFATRDDLKVYATREDIANLKNSMIRWSVGSMLALTGTIVTAFKWILP